MAIKSSVGDPAGQRAWFKKVTFWVAVRTPDLGRHRPRTQGPAVGLVLRKARVAEHFQPVRVRLAGQQLRWAFAHPFGTFTAWEAAVIEKELQQDQIIRAD